MTNRKCYFFLIFIYLSCWDKMVLCPNKSIVLRKYKKKKRLKLKHYIYCIILYFRNMNGCYIDKKNMANCFFLCFAGLSYKIMHKIWSSVHLFVPQKSVWSLCLKGSYVIIFIWLPQILLPFQGKSKWKRLLTQFIILFENLWELFINILVENIIYEY